MHVHVTWFPEHAGPSGPVEVRSDASTVTVMHVLDALDVAPDTVLVVRGGQPIPLDAPMCDGDAVRLVQTMSGG